MVVSKPRFLGPRNPFLSSESTYRAFLIIYSRWIPRWIPKWLPRWLPPCVRAYISGTRWHRTMTEVSLPRFGGSRNPFLPSNPTYRACLIKYSRWLWKCQPLCLRAYISETRWHWSIIVVSLPFVLRVDGSISVIILKYSRWFPRSL